MADKDDVDPLDAGFYRRVKDFRDDAKALAASAFAQKHADAFLLHHGPLGSLKTPLRPQATVAIQAPTGGDTPTAQSDFLVFPVKRSGRSQFPNFISVGRTRNNDVVIADISLSKFHAFFKIAPTGLLLQDAGSKNGTFMNDVRIPSQQQGAAVALDSGALLRFGSVELSFMDADSFANLVRMLIA